MAEKHTCDHSSPANNQIKVQAQKGLGFRVKSLEFRVIVWVLGLQFGVKSLEFRVRV